MSQKTLREIELDVTELPSPQPIERVLDALVDLSVNETLKVRFPRDPVLLYPILKGMNMIWERVSSNEDGVVELLIREQTG